MNAGPDRAWQARDHLAARVHSLPASELDGIVRGMGRRCSGYLASRKNGASVPWRVRNERDLMRLFEVDHGILSYEALAERVEFVLDGRRHRVVPAVRASTVRGPMVFDVLRTDTASAARRQVADAVADIYAGLGVKYRCLAPREVRLEPRRSNVAYVRSFKQVECDERTRLRIVRALSDGDMRWDVASLRQALGPDGDAVFDLAMRRVVRLDLSAPRPSAMRVTLGAGA